MNVDKAELVAVIKGKYSEYTYEVVDHEVQTQTNAKCLGVLWRYNLSQGKSVEECIYTQNQLNFHSGIH